MTAKAKTEPVDEVLEVVPTAEPETQELHVRNVYQRMIDAQRVIDSMPFIKDMANSQFKSIPIDQMRAAVRRACIEAGLVHVGLADRKSVVTSATTSRTGTGASRSTPGSACSDTSTPTTRPTSWTTPRWGRRWTPATRAPASSCPTSSRPTKRMEYGEGSAERTT